MVQLRQHVFHTPTSNAIVGLAMETWSCAGGTEQVQDLVQWVFARFEGAFHDWHVQIYGITPHALVREGYGDIVEHRERAYKPYCRLLASTLHLIMNNLLFHCVELGVHHEVCHQLQHAHILLYNRPSYEDTHYVLPLKLVEWSFNEFGKRFSSEVRGFFR